MIFYALKYRKPKRCKKCGMLSDYATQYHKIITVQKKGIEWLKSNVTPNSVFKKCSIVKIKKFDGNCHLHEKRYFGYEVINRILRGKI